MKKLFERIYDTFLKLDHPGQRIKRILQTLYVVSVVIITIAGAISGMILGGVWGRDLSDNIASNNANDYIYEKYVEAVDKNKFDGNFSEYKDKNISIYNEVYSSSFNTVSPVLGPTFIVLFLAIFTIAGFFLAVLLFWVPSIIFYSFAELVDNSTKLVNAFTLPDAPKNSKQRKKEECEKRKKESQQYSNLPKVAVKQDIHTKANNAFATEINSLTDDELMLIYLDQQDLYNEEEIEEIRKNLLDKGLISECDFDDGENYSINSDYIKAIMTPTSENQQKKPNKPADKVISVISLVVIVTIFIAILVMGISFFAGQ